MTTTTATTETRSRSLWTIRRASSTEYTTAPAARSTTGARGVDLEQLATTGARIVDHQLATTGARIVDHQLATVGRVEASTVGARAASTTSSRPATTGARIVDHQLATVGRVEAATTGARGVDHQLATTGARRRPPARDRRPR